MSVFRANIRAYAVACGILTAVFLGAMMFVSGEFQRKAGILQGTLSGGEVLTTAIAELLVASQSDDKAAVQELSRSIAHQIRTETHRLTGLPQTWPTVRSDADTAVLTDWTTALSLAEALERQAVQIDTDGAHSPETPMKLQTALIRAYGSTGYALAALWERKNFANQTGVALAAFLMLGNLYFLFGHVLISYAPEADSGSAANLPDQLRDATGGFLTRVGLETWLKALRPDQTHILVLLTLSAPRGQETHTTMAHHETCAAKLKEALAERECSFRSVPCLAPNTHALVFNEGMVKSVQEVFDDLRRSLDELAPDPALALVSRLVAGVATLRPHRSSVLALENAELALNASLDGRDDYTLYSPALKRASLNRDRLRADLERAIQHNEFIAFFQPQLEVGTQRIIGAEALVRWQHPKRGLVPPSEFLPPLFANGHAFALALDMVEQAAKALVAFGRAGHFVPDIGVNVTRDELLKPELSDHLKWALEKHDLMPERLRIEVLETIRFGGSGDPAIASLHTLSDCGFRIDLDDFGTGNTSITGFRRLPVDRVKIDRSYIRNLDTDPANRELVKAIISMGHALKVDVLAEGVESAQELRVLERFGCDHAQGYHFAKPMPLDQMIVWLDAHAFGTADDRDIRTDTAPVGGGRVQEAG